MRQRWSAHVAPLLCGLLAGLCFIALAVRPPGNELDFLLFLFALLFTLLIASVWELLGPLKERSRIELRIVRHRGAERSAFVVSIPAHIVIGLLLLSIGLVGASANVLLFATAHPSELDIPGLEMLVKVGLSIGIAGIVWCLVWPLIRPGSLVLLPEGVLLPRQATGCFLPWELIEAVAPVKLQLLPGRKPLHLGFRVTEVERIEASPKVRRGIAALHQFCGWHFLCVTIGLTLSAEQLAPIVQAYLLHPEERRKIGTQPELEEIKASLASARSSARE